VLHHTSDRLVIRFKDKGDITSVGQTIGPFSIIVLADAPNPFTESTRVILEASTAGHITSQIYHVTGRLVAPVLSRFVDAGQYLVSWNGRDSRGHDLPPGIHFSRFDTGEHVTTRKVVMVR
jgi:hypothetical protein